MSKIIIAFAGTMRSGKTTAARYIRDTYGATIFTIAEPIKRQCMALYDLTPDQVYGTQEQKETVDPRYNKSPRKLMQDYGQLMRDEFGEDIWIDKCLKEIAKSDSSIIAIDDCRHPNEAASIVEQNYSSAYPVYSCVIKLVCTDDIAVDSQYSKHISEVGVGRIPNKHLLKTIESPRTPGATDLLCQVAETVSNYIEDIVIVRNTKL